MPPKKKKGKGKGKKKKGKKDDGELTIEDKYKRTLDEIEALKDNLAARKELARRSQAAGDEWRSRMKEAEETLEEQQSDARAVSADMTRQYKTMQTEMGIRLHQLEADLIRTHNKLEKTEQELKKCEEEKEQMCREKDQEIVDLKLNIETMGLQYEHILSDTLERLVDKIASAKNQWGDRGTMIQSANKQALLEFGLNPLDI